MIDNSLLDKVIIITGGSKGIGKSLVEFFCSEGCRVYFTYLNSAKNTHDLCAILKKKRKNVFSMQVDNREREQIEKFVSSVIEIEGQIDVLINNAGVIPRGLIFDTPMETWQKCIETNMYGVIHYSKAVLKSMVLKKRGVILNISSISAQRPVIGQAAYSASKAAIESLTKAFALEYGKFNIRINTIAPGLIETGNVKTITQAIKDSNLEKTPLKSLATVGDICSAAYFLASDMAKSITGIQLVISGGRHLN